MLREPLAVAKWVLRPPVIYSPAAISWETHIISMPPQPSNVQRDGDVIDSFSRSSLTATLIWMALIYFILIAFRKVYQMFDKRKDKNIRWTILRAACFQSDFRFKQLSFRLISICILIGLFVTKAFYDGSFKTDLTIKEQLDYIDNVGKLLKLRLWPAFLHGDTAINYFQTSKFEDEREIYLIAKKRDEKGLDSFMEINFDTMVKLIELIRRREAVMVAQFGAEQMLRAIDCKQQVGLVSEGSKVIPLYTSAKGYNDEINSFIYNPNISLILKARLDMRILTLFEMHIFIKDGVTDFREMLAKGLMSEGNFNYLKCVNPRHEENEHRVFPLRIINVTKLLRLMGRCLAFAATLLLLEIMKQFLKKRARRNRKKMLRRLNARRRLEVMRFQSRRKVSWTVALQHLEP